MKYRLGNAENQTRMTQHKNPSQDSVNNCLADLRLTTDKRKSLNSASYWSSNVSLRSSLNQSESRKSSGQNMTGNVSQLLNFNSYTRPMTARSLPSKVPDATINNNSSSSVMNQHTGFIRSAAESNFLPISSSVRVKNPSCPSITSSSNQTTIVNVSSQNRLNLEDDLDDQYETTSQIVNYNDQGEDKTSNDGGESSDNESLVIYTPHDDSAAQNFEQPLLPPASHKSNLDYFLKCTSNPFTTKFEMMSTTTTATNEPSSIVASRSSNNFVVGGKKSSSNVNLSQSNAQLASEKVKKQDQPYGSMMDDRPSVSQLSINELQFTYSPNDFPSSSNGESDKPSSNFLRITDDLFIGNMNCLKNERKMCRLGIEYLVDMTNLRPDELTRKTLGRIPCLCQRQHSRLYLSVEIGDTNFRSLFAAFNEINKFIQRARRTSQATSTAKRVLIFSKDLLAPHLVCACAQFLMLEYEMSVDMALHVVLVQRKSNSNAAILLSKFDACYKDYLKQFESYLRHLSIPVDTADLTRFSRNDGVGLSSYQTSRSSKKYFVSDGIGSNKTTSTAVPSSSSAASSFAMRQRLLSIEKERNERRGQFYTELSKDDDQELVDDHENTLKSRQKALTTANETKKSNYHSSKLAWM